MSASTSRTLTIIVGAGASHDCAGSANTQANERLRPPLAKHVFAETFQDILKNYPRVERRSDEIRTRLSKGENLEQILRDFWESAERNRNNWLLDVPRYLRELFWTISQDYLPGTSKYDTLVRCVLDYSVEKVLFLNLNYDLFLESAIEGYDGHEFATLDSYIPPDKKWALVKPHGSVNWARILENCPKYVGGLPRPPSDLQELPIFGSELKVILWNRHSREFYVPGSATGGYLYPQVVVPADRPKEFISPQTHVDKARTFLESCTDFLLIGFSGHDDDVLSLLQVIPPRSRLTIVSKGDARAIFSRIESSAPEFATKELAASFFDEGFSAYVDSDDFKKLTQF